MEEKKNVLMSKTIWVNFLMAVAAIVGVWVPEVQEVFNESNIMIFFSMVNIVLRAATKEAVSFK